MRKLFSKSNAWKKVLAFVMCSALVMGEVPMNDVKAADTPQPKIMLEAYFDSSDNNEAKLKATLKSAVSKCTWFYVDQSGQVPATGDLQILDDNPKFSDLEQKIQSGSIPNDFTGLALKGTYETGPNPTDIDNVETRFNWDSKDKVLEVDTIGGVSVQDNAIVGIANSMAVIDAAGDQVTTFTNLQAGDYTVQISYGSIKAKATYTIEAGSGADESASPSDSTSSTPSADPTAAPVIDPTVAPVVIDPPKKPDIAPTTEPTVAPTVEPTVQPTEEPAVEPTVKPTEEPAPAVVEPTVKPTQPAVVEPTVKPTEEPVIEPTTKPTEEPVVEPTAKPETNETVTVGKAEFTVDSKSQSVAYEGTASTSKTVTVPAAVKINGVSYPVTSVSDGAFKNSSVKSVTLGKNVTTVGKNAFKGCTKLTKVSFPAKLQKVEAGAFTGCKKLTSVSLPKAVKTIGAKAFKNCKSLKKVTIGQAPKKTRKAQILFGSYEKSRVLFAVPESTKVSIGASALENCVKLRSVIINSQVTKIGSRTFQHCKELASVLVKSLKLRAVGDNALKGVNNCKISVPTIRLRKYRTLFKNKGQGRKVVIAKV